MNKLLTFGIVSLLLVLSAPEMRSEVSEASPSSVVEQEPTDSKSSQSMKQVEGASGCNPKEGFVPPRIVYSVDPELTERDAKRRYVGKYQFSLTVD